MVPQYSRARDRVIFANRLVLCPSGGELPWKFCLVVVCALGRREALLDLEPQDQAHHFWNFLETSHISIIMNFK